MKVRTTKSRLGASTTPRKLYASSGARIAYSTVSTVDNGTRVTISGRVVAVRTGLPLATYFSGPKIKWMLENVAGVKDAAQKGDALYYANYFADKTFNPFISYPIVGFYFICLTLIITTIYGAVNSRLNRHLPSNQRAKIRLRPNLVR